VISDLEGSQAWYETENSESHEDPDDLSLMRRVKQAPARKDGSVIVDCTPGEVAALARRAIWLMDKSRDGISWGERDALADYNAGLALSRKLGGHL
jgi:hypothetical protein